jgi:hypothetical protein
MASLTQHESQARTLVHVGTGKARPSSFGLVVRRSAENEKIGA